MGSICASPSRSRELTPPSAAAWFAAPDVVALGDGALGGSIAFYSEGEQGLTIGTDVEAFIPWGTSTSLASDTEFGFRGQLLAGLRARADRHLAHGRRRLPAERDLAVSAGRGEIEYALSLLFPALPVLDIVVELTGSVGLRSTQSSIAVPVETMLGMRGHLDVAAGRSRAESRWESRRRLAFPTRAILGLRWVLPPDPPGDTDKDGLLDPDDQCVDQPEDDDGWEDDDGCVDPDDDSDGWMDESDAVPTRDRRSRRIPRHGWLPRHGRRRRRRRGREDQCPRSPGATFQGGCPQLMRLEPTRVVLLWPNRLRRGDLPRCR